MTDYISREMTFDAICRLCNANFEEDPCEPSECEMMSLLRKIPAADVREVVRGKWIYNEAYVLGNPYGSYRCTACSQAQAHKSNYCPNCGANMREPPKEET